MQQQIIYISNIGHSFVPSVEVSSLIIITAQQAVIRKGRQEICVPGAELVTPCVQGLRTVEKLKYHSDMYLLAISTGKYKSHFIP